MADNFYDTLSTPSRGQKYKPKRLFDENDSDYLLDKLEYESDYSPRQKFVSSSPMEDHLKSKPSTSKYHFAKTPSQGKKYEPRQLFYDEPSIDESKLLAKDTDESYFEESDSEREQDFIFEMAEKNRGHLKSKQSTPKQRPLFSGSDSEDYFEEMFRKVPSYSDRWEFNVE